MIEILRNRIKAYEELLKQLEESLKIKSTQEMELYFYRGTKSEAVAILNEIEKDAVEKQAARLLSENKDEAVA